MLFFAICNIRAQKVLYSDKKQYNAEVVCPDALVESFTILDFVTK